MKRKWKTVLIACLGVLVGLTLTPSSFGDAGGVIAGKLEGNRRYLKNAIVYVEEVPGTHAAPRAPVEMDQRNHKFIPHVLPVVKGTTVRFLNNDSENHNVFSPDHEGYNLGNWPGGEHRDRRFMRQGVYTQLCRLHPSMLAFVVVLQNPHFATAADDGSFRIAGVPAGTYRLRAWQERAEGAVDVTVRSGKEVQVQIPLSRRRR